MYVSVYKYVPDGIDCLTFSTCIIFGEKSPKRTKRKTRENYKKATDSTIFTVVNGHVK